MKNENIAVQLNKQIANWSLLYMKLHHHHWHVKGPDFFTLHEKFEELYHEAAEHMDSLAERLLAIGGHPAATLREHLQLATVKEAVSVADAVAIVQETAEDFKLLIRELKQARAVCAEEEDEVTADLLLAIQASLEKHVWMLSAFLNK